MSVRVERARLVAWRGGSPSRSEAAFRNEGTGVEVLRFRDPHASVLVLGLAPRHMANRTGRVFTVRSSGAFLYPAMYRVGLANSDVGLIDEGSR